MSINSFATKLEKFRQWRDTLIATIGEYQDWIEQQGETDGEQDLRIYQLIDSLKSDKLVIALVGEFSRGKTELLNAIFFPEYKQRLLPSAAGRTTMCPTELRFDKKDDPYIKLLPIETRKTSITIAEYKKTPVHWTTRHILKASSIDEVREAFLEVTKTKKVHTREAQELGMYNPDDVGPDAIEVVDGKVEVPMWRQAIINFPHPLLEQGLVILDTPGLNALGAEPELTLSTLPSAHAVLFLLAIDTGVTRTDLEIWNTHVNVSKSEKGHENIVALNKIDGLWDDMQDESAIARMLSEQVDETARILGIEKKQIFPISAKNGLIAKVKNDKDLLEKSGVLELENKLANDIVPAKHEIIRHKVVYEISGRLEASRSLLETQLESVNKQIRGLQSLGNKSLDEIKQRVAEVRQEKGKYDREVKGFQATRTALGGQAKVLFGHLSMENFDRLVARTRQDMQESWTTRGLKIGMATFFTGAAAPMEEVRKQAGEIKKLIDLICTKMHTEYGLSEIRPANLSLLPYVLELKKLQQKAEVFRNSPVVIVTEQHSVIEKFFITMVSQARVIFTECNEKAKVWFQTVGSQVFAQIQEHKKSIDRDMNALRKVHENMDNLGAQLAGFDKTRKTLSKQLATIDGLIERIQQPIS
ncbi:MAG: dynamin-like GTPase family protein [Gammaproteobacteria bacterium]|nr:MAG: dynamin-like GTPase family protein [Gammaproteobacteria bacterium]